MRITHGSIISLIILCCISWSMSGIAITYDALVEQAQNRLIELGYDPGPVDGMMGNKTVVALKSFQKNNALQQTGELNEVTQEKLGISDAEVLPNPGNLKGIPNPTPGDTMLFRVTGKITGGSIWGTDFYTTDSALSTVVVHAGVLKDGETGVVKATFAPGQDAYEGISRNGVTSSSWGRYAISYHVESVTLETEEATVQDRTVSSDPGNLVGFTDAKAGDSMFFKLIGKTSGGSVWGTDTYTTDSALAIVAVHAGVLKNGEEGIVKVTFTPGQDTYEGTTRSGVTSSSWGSYQMSYTVEAAMP